MWSVATGASPTKLSKKLSGQGRKNSITKLKVPNQPDASVHRRELSRTKGNNEFEKAAKRLKALENLQQTMSLFPKPG